MGNGYSESCSETLIGGLDRKPLPEQLCPVREGRGLACGIEGSQATRQRVKAYYGALQVTAGAEVPPEGVVALLNAKVRVGSAPVAKNAAMVLLARRRVQELQRTNTQLQVHSDTNARARADV